MGVVTATWALGQALSGGAEPREDVEPAATVKRAVSSMGGKAGWSRLAAFYQGLEVEAGVAVEPRR